MLKKRCSMELIQINPRQRSQVHDFVKLPFQLYKDCPQWVPPLSGDAYGVFDEERHPYYEHSQAAFFLVREGRQTLGRLAVLHNRNFCVHHGVELGFFYYFDSVDSEAVAKLLIEGAREWGKARGLAGFYGAKGFSRADGQGVLVEGFEHDAVFGVPYNYAYYDRLLTAAGMRKHTDFLSGYMMRGMESAFPEKLFEAARRVRERGGFSIKHFRTTDEMREWIPRLESVHEKAFAGNPGFIPSTRREFKKMAEGILLIADPELILLVLKGEEVVGFVLTYPEIGPAVRRQGGQLFPFGWVDMLREKRRTDTITLNGIGILPEYQGFGANIMLHAEIASILMGRKNVRRVEMNQVDENNYRSLADLERIGTRFYKRHRMYVLPLDGGKDLELPKQWKLSGGDYQ